jgi:hypothetical protein
LPLFGFFGWRILLESDQGNLVIESESDTTKIEIKRRAGGATQEMIVEPGAKLTRLHAGDYDITIHEGSDQVSIEPKQVQLRRGETVIARIVRSQKQESGSTQSGTRGGGGAAVPVASQRSSFAGVSLPASVETLLFKGKSLSEWLLVLERERDPDEWKKAFEALHKADPQLVNSLAHAIRELGLQHHFFSPVENGWFLPVFSHEVLDRLVLDSIQGESLQACLEILSAVAEMPQLKMCNGDVYQASRLSQSWAFVEVDMVAPDEVVNQFWNALKRPATANPLDWIVESGRDQSKIDRLLKFLPESFADLELGVSHVVLETDRSVHCASFVVDPGMGVGRDRFEIILKLEAAGWRVATFKYGKNIIEF